MSALLKAVAGLFALLGLPFTIYGSWLLYNHVQATDLMWFIWWVTIPLIVISQVFSELAKAWDKEAA